MRDLEGRGANAPEARPKFDPERLQGLVERLTQDLERHALENAGRIDEDRFKALERLRGLIALKARGALPRATMMTLTFLLVAFAVVLCLSEFHVSSPEATAELEVASVQIGTRSGVARSRSLLGPSKLVRLGAWSDPVLPKSCAAYSLAHAATSNGYLSIEASSNAVVPVIGLGDDATLPKSLRISFSPGREGALVLQVLSRGSDLHVPVAIDNGVLAVRAADDATVQCVIEGERLEFTVDQLEFSPVGIVGPISATSVDFSERILSADQQDSMVSTVASGTINFPDIPGADIHLREGDRIDFGLVDGGTTYLRPKSNAVHTIVRGRFSKIRINGSDQRPSIVEYLANNPSLRLLAAALSTVAAVVIWIMRWFDASRV